MIQYSSPILVLTGSIISSAAWAKGGVLLFVAHPDDELAVAPLLADLSRRDVRISIAYATAGEEGVQAGTSLPSGEALGEARKIEAKCASRVLGARDPIFLGFADGQLGKFQRPPWGYLGDLRTRVGAVVRNVAPDVVVTWGPDGGYGHPDHRLVSSITTEVIQSSLKDRPRLFYIGLSAKALRTSPPRILPWAGADEKLLTYRYSFSAIDLAQARDAALCHKTQFPTPAASKRILDELVAVMGGAVRLRPALPMSDPDKLIP